MLAAVAALTCAGCGPQGVKKVTVHGTVTYKGQPVPSGIVKFVGPEGSYSAASLRPDGTFVITDVVPGEVKVGVMEAPQGSGSSGGDDKSAKAPKAPVNLPQKLREPDTSGVTYTITPDTRDIAIELK